MRIYIQNMRLVKFMACLAVNLEIIECFFISDLICLMLRLEVGVGI